MAAITPQAYTARLLASVRDRLRHGDDGTRVAWEAIGGLQWALKWLRDNRPADAPALHAEVAGHITAIHLLLYGQEPQQADLATIFETALNGGTGHVT